MSDTISASLGLGTHDDSNKAEDQLLTNSQVERLFNDIVEEPSILQEINNNIDEIPVEIRPRPNSSVSETETESEAARNQPPPAYNFHNCVVNFYSK